MMVLWRKVVNVYKMEDCIDVNLFPERISEMDINLSLLTDLTLWESFTFL